MNETRQTSLKELENTYPLLQQLTQNLSPAQLDFRTDPDGWTIREILAHLVDDEMYVMRTRMERIIKEDEPHLAPHDEKKWFAHRNKTRDALDDLLADFQLQRAASLGMLHMLRDSDWQRTGYQPEYGRFTAEEWLSHWVEHDTVHIQQIERILARHKPTM